MKLSGRVRERRKFFFYLFVSKLIKELFIGVTWVHACGEWECNNARLAQLEGEC